jgi:hypothetical protein
MTEAEIASETFYNHKQKEAKRPNVLYVSVRRRIFVKKLQTNPFLCQGKTGKHVSMLSYRVNVTVRTDNG